ncbi:DUF3757 domain-containing protein [Yersinia ruckeri]|uniref:DUF3757 domain-containing protein n=1 Tax=Yersinia ruckeri TaxID=29486 RepID=UPI0005374EED|nr:DUF3757 domain-containing protein [Yersinia ruckeri]AUQ40975.1 DUF3757 domain-containing protein [Yersinia ruckeri]EKN3361259.1 DUF3757 domain-containing protein [Yersinia ruckeri]EKN4201840.1 DUF3757 domain-containing protein [Yersinia ruckeri]EKN4207586.1 DUF3757 domain-containing protein [Yersinia ruckeri]EKN4688627.1 DUF3757 domain-containing protein [Yersinia ruckeri]
MEKTGLFLLLTLSLFSQSVSASINMCPNPSDIDEAQGLGLYSTPDGKWLGVSQGIENNGEVKQFLLALYHPYKNNDREIGTLVRCTYKLDFGTIDMYLKDEDVINNRGFFVSIIGSTFWHKVTSPFHDDKYVCYSTDVKYCSFERLGHYQIKQYE